LSCRGRPRPTPHHPARPPPAHAAPPPAAARPPPPPPPIQDRNSTVLPLPGGADTTLTRACAVSRPNSRGRATTPPAPRPAPPPTAASAPATDPIVPIIAPRPTTNATLSNWACRPSPHLSQRHRASLIWHRLENEPDTATPSSTNQRQVSVERRVCNRRVTRIRQHGHRMLVKVRVAHCREFVQVWLYGLGRFVETAELTLGDSARRVI